MIEEPPLIQIRDTFPRPSPAQIDAFRDVPTGNICDAMGGIGALDMAIKPMSAAVNVCGPALPVRSGASDILALTVALTEVAEGDVIINAVDGFQGCAAIGDLISGMAQNAGAAGVVTDGPCRDIAAIEALGFPVFATGINPNSPYGKGPGTVGMGVDIGGRSIGPGDMIIGDRDGVVSVPFDQIDAVIAALAEVQAAEVALEAEVKAGLKAPPAALELAASDQVKRI